MRVSRIVGTLLLLGPVMNAAAQQPVQAVRPEQPIELFNGRDLSHFETWLKKTQQQDPQGVFSVQDGVIHVSGEDAGYLATRQAYRDYHLSLEYRWGERTFGSKYVRNSGVLLHGVGPHGGSRGVWMTCIEVQLAQGCAGDFIVIRGKDDAGETIPATLTSDTVLGTDKKTRWQRGGKPTVYSGRQFWWSQHDPTFKELIDTRGQHDVESQLGEWTRVDCICRGDRITVKINGTTVNECYDVFPSAGRILLQSEGFEMDFRKVMLRPLAEEEAQDSR